VEYYPDKVSRPDNGLGLGSVSRVRSHLTSLHLSIICLSIGINPARILWDAETDPEDLVGVVYDVVEKNIKSPTRRRKI